MKRQSNLPFRVLLTLSSDGMGRQSYLKTRTYIIYSRLKMLEDDSRNQMEVRIWDWIFKLKILL